MATDILVSRELKSLQDELSDGAHERDKVMNLLLLVLLALPLACLALLSFVAFLGVAAIGGALHVIGTITSALGVAVRKNADPWHGAVGDAHPLDYVEAQH